MNEDQIKGAAKVVGGRFEKVAGDALDNSEMRVGGSIREGVGHAQKAYGTISGAARDIARSIEEKPRLSAIVGCALGLFLGLLIAGRGPKVIYVKPPA